MQAIEKHNQSKAVSILVDAFEEDPFTSWFSPKPGFVRLLFELMMPSVLEQGVAYMTDDEDGAALWMKPGHELDVADGLKGLYRLIMGGGILSVFRLLRMVIACKHPKEPHYYLFLIGCEPVSRGKGIGSALMEHMLKRSDSENMPIYLENSKEKNLAFYQKHGFKVIKEIQLGKQGPRLWQMWREPVPVNKS